MDEQGQADDEPIEELQLHRLLVAIDGSPSSELALRAAMKAARVDNAAITLLVVVPDMVVEAARWEIHAMGPDPAELQRDADRGAQALIRRTLQRLPGDLPVKTRIRHGKPGREICAEAAEHDYDAILLGARGVGRIGALMGSVSSYVMHHATTAVIVVHPPASA